MPALFLRAPGLSLFAFLAAASPALAQSAPIKDQWGAFRDFLRERGVMIAARSLSDSGDSLTLGEVSVFALAEPDDFVVSIPQLVVTQDGEHLVLTPSAEFTATARSGSTTHVFTVTHDGALRTLAGENRVSLGFDFPSFALALTEATRGGTPLPQTASITAQGMTFGGDAYREGAADFLLSIASLSYAYDLGPDAGENPLGSRASASAVDVQFSFEGNELDMLDAVESSATPMADLFNAGFFVRADFSVGPGTSSGEQVIEGMPVVLDSTTEGGSVSFAMQDGRLDLAIRSGSGVFEGSGGPFQGRVGFDALTFGVGAPLTTTAANSQAHYRFAFDNIVPSGPMLALANLQDFEGEVLNVALDITADARLTQELSERAMNAAVPPFDATSVTLGQLLVGVGASSLTGSGAISFDRGLIASMGASGVPDGTGDFTFDLVGGNALLTRLTAAGLIPQDQIFVAQMMMNGLGRSVGDDHLRAEVAIRPGGVVTVNGAPLPF